MSGRNISLSRIGKSDKRELKVVVGSRGIAVSGMFKKFDNLDVSYKVLDDRDKETPDIVVFTGGPDISPSLYGEEKIRGTNVQGWRDDEDIALYEKYEHIPKVGICRGAQFLNVMSGGALWQHVDNHDRPHQLLNLLPMGARWQMGDTLKVSSTHHQMMIPGPDGVVLGVAVNREETAGIANKYFSQKSRSRPSYDTEVVWYESTESLCFQPHPENIGAFETQKYFFDLLNFFFLKVK